MENFLPFTEDVMVVLVHKCAQQTHLLALHLETLGYIPRLLNALNGLVYFLIIGDPRGDNLMVGSISRKLLTELGIRTEDAECKLMGDKCNFVKYEQSKPSSIKRGCHTYQSLDNVDMNMYAKFCPNIPCGSRVMSIFANWQNPLDWCSANSRPSKEAVTHASG